MSIIIRSENIRNNRDLLSEMKQYLMSEPGFEDFRREFWRLNTDVTLNDIVLEANNRFDVDFTLV